MLSRPFTTGAIMLVVAGAFAGGLWQGQQAREQAARVSQLPEDPVLPVSEPELAATGPVVDETQDLAIVPEPVELPQPVVEPEPELAALPEPVAEPQPEVVAATPPPVNVSEDVAPETPAGPIVTVNGRPLGVDRVILPAPDGSTAPTAPRTATVPPAPAPVQAPAPSTATSTPDSSVAVLAPPRPIPRPEGLSLPSSAYTVVPPRDDIDYEGIAAAAYGSAGDEFMSYERRMALEPIGGELVGRVGDPIPVPVAPVPQESGLVQVVGPNGETIWVYEDQLRGNSSVTFRNRPASNDYGFIYDDDRYYRW